MLGASFGTREDFAGTVFGESVWPLLITFIFGPFVSSDLASGAVKINVNEMPLFFIYFKYILLYINQITENGRYTYFRMFCY